VVSVLLNFAGSLPASVSAQSLSARSVSAQQLNEEITYANMQKKRCDSDLIQNSEFKIENLD
jgi:hypothetical protein